MFDEKVSRKVYFAFSGQIWASHISQQIELESYSNPLKSREVL